MNPHRFTRSSDRHLINTVYHPARVVELRGMRGFYANPVHYERLMVVVTERLGHELAARAEHAKIDVTEGGATRIDLSHTGRNLGTGLSEARAGRQSRPTSNASSARQDSRWHEPGSRRRRSTRFTSPADPRGCGLLADRIAAAFPAAGLVRGDRFASVVTGLGLYARRWFGR